MDNNPQVLDEGKPSKPLCDIGTAFLNAMLLLGLVGLLNRSVGEFIWEFWTVIGEVVRGLSKAFLGAAIWTFVAVTLWRPRLTKKYWNYIGIVAVWAFSGWVLIQVMGMTFIVFPLSGVATVLSLIGLLRLFDCLVLRPIKKQTRFGEWAAKNPVIREYFPDVCSQ